LSKWKSHVHVGRSKNLHGWRDKIYQRCGPGQFL